MSLHCTSNDLCDCRLQLLQRSIVALHQQSHARLSYDHQCRTSMLWPQQNFLQAIAARVGQSPSARASGLRLIAEAFRAPAYGTQSFTESGKLLWDLHLGDGMVHTPLRMFRGSHPYFCTQHIPFLNYYCNCQHENQARPIFVEISGKGSVGGSCPHNMRCDHSHCPPIEPAPHQTHFQIWHHVSPHNHSPRNDNQ